MNKKLFSLLAMPLAFTPVIATVSVTKHIREEANPKKEKKEKKLDPNFSKFDENAKEKVKAMIESLVKNAEKIAKTLHDSAREAETQDFKEKLRKIIYLKELVKYFKNNADAIKSNPFEWGIAIVFPYVISKNEKLINSEIEFGGKVYKQIRVGSKEYTNYKQPITSEGNDFTLSEAKKKIIQESKGKVTQDPKGEEVNGFSEEDFNKQLKKYAKNLSDETKKIIFDEGDIPKFELKYEDLDNITWGNPEGAASWSEYIFKKIYSRFIDFDLRQNQESKDEEEQKEQQESPSNPPSTPELVPGQPIKPEKKSDQFEYMTSLPSLTPYIAPQFASKNLNEFKTLFDSASGDEKLKMFFFNNPINTRYEYKVVSFDVSDGKFINVKSYISDRLSTNLSRSYTLEKVDYKNEFAKNTLLKNSIDAVYGTFQRIVTALGIDDKLDYSKLGNSNLHDALFNMVKIANERILLDDKPNGPKNSFKSLQNQVSNHYLNKISSGSKNENVLYRHRQATTMNFLSELSSASVDTKSKFWTILADKFQVVYYQFEAVINANIEMIQKNHALIRKTPAVLNQLFKTIEKDIFRFKSLANQTPINRRKWFDEYVYLVAKISKAMRIMSPLLTPNEIKDFDTKLKEEFLKNYNSANEFVNKEINSKNQIKKVFSYIILTFGILVALAATIVLIVKRKNLKNKQILLLLIIIYLCSLALILSGIGMLFIMPKGI
ncbi:MSC_0620 family F1-like ATPase-associated subunit [Metamycoplasma equirhinis]|uniref:MSC_0620 family F1-like ATPase-associated subunit n=1 Tax=Metamycoplasma equirhinis TaxID=92402 RepID=UPI0035943C7C